MLYFLWSLANKKSFDLLQIEIKQLCDNRREMTENFASYDFQLSLSVVCILHKNVQIRQLGHDKA